MIESLLAVAPAGTHPSFYRTNAGAEIDLLLTWPNGEHWAIEIKRSTTPSNLSPDSVNCHRFKLVTAKVIHAAPGCFSTTIRSSSKR